MEVVLVPAVPPVPVAATAWSLAAHPIIGARQSHKAPKNAREPIEVMLDSCSDHANAGDGLRSPVIP